MTKLDAKFYGEIRKVKDDSIVPDDEYMVFLAKDNAFPNTLEYYLATCRRLRCDKEHLASVERTLERLYAWREANPYRLKNPDAHGEKLAG
jgi:hypothetical protein